MWKALKKQAKKRLAKCYGFFVALCLVAALFGLDYRGSVAFITTNVLSNAPDNVVITEVYSKLVTGQHEAGAEISEEAKENISDRNKKIGIIALEHESGVLASLVNSVSTGSVLVIVYNAIASLVKSHSAAQILFIILTAFVVLSIWMFVINLYKLVYKRCFLESRIYNRVPAVRFLFFYETGTWWRAAYTMALYNLFEILWMFTVVGGFIKHFAYLLVPYIVAENPKVSGIKAIKLSERMMKGHKWEAFLLTLSFLGWDALDILTLGLAGIFFVNPYKEATFSEYYAHLRELAKESGIEGAELLNDTYLYEKADPALLRETYSDYDPACFEEELPKHRSVKRVLENVFGITLKYDRDEQDYERISAERYRMRNIRRVIEQEMYPRCLFTIAGNSRAKHVSNLYYDRHYSIISFIFLFFVFCLIGWLWEVFFHFAETGTFVNRGFLHGPWIPIYGSGGGLMLLLLNKFRKRPWLEFIMAILLCGVLEYFTAVILEATHDGTKWWDYTGYFLNINGRVCAEGLLVFGIGGIAIVYILAPFFDNLFRLIPIKVGAIIAAVLISAFVVDVVYSFRNPNAGAGITDFENAETTQAETQSRIVELDDPIIIQLESGRQC